MSNVELSPEIAKFIEENINLIENKEWDKIYEEAYDVPSGFAEAMLAADINPLYQGLTYIPDWFLYLASSIESFTIPDTVTSIGDCAFQGCINLTNIEIPDTVTYVGNYAFASCPKLTEIKINQTVQQVKDNLELHIRNNWQVDSGVKKIICTDGEINLK